MQSRKNRRMNQEREPAAISTEGRVFASEVRARRSSPRQLTLRDALAHNCDAEFTFIKLRYHEDRLLQNIRHVLLEISLRISGRRGKARLSHVRTEDSSAAASLWNEKFQKRRPPTA